MPGETAPDFALARMEAFLDTPEHSDQNPRDPVDILTPLAAKEFLQVMSGFEVRDGRIVAKPDESSREPTREFLRQRLSVRHADRNRLPDLATRATTRFDSAAIAARFRNAIWMSARVVSVDRDRGQPARLQCPGLVGEHPTL
jgi:hypothetical protein